MPSGLRLVMVNGAKPSSCATGRKVSWPMSSSSITLNSAHQPWRAALAAEEDRHIARRRNREFEITLRREAGARHLDEQLFAVSHRRPQLVTAATRPC